MILALNPIIIAPQCLPSIKIGILHQSLYTFNDKKSFLKQDYYLIDNIDSTISQNQQVILPNEQP